MATVAEANLADRSYWPLMPTVAATSIIVTTIGFLAPLLLTMAGDLGVAPSEIGQLVVFTALPWALLAPFCGLLSDRLGRRPVIFAALIGMGLATCAGAFASGFGVLVAVRLLAGAFGSGGPPTIMTGLIEHYPTHQRGRVLGWTNTSFSLAALIGVPLVGAIGGAFGWRTAFLVVGLALLIAALLLWVWYPQTAPSAGSGGSPLGAYRYLFGKPHLATLLISNLCERITSMALTLYLPSLLIRSYGFDPITIAPLLMVIALGALAGMVGGGVLADRSNAAWLAGSTLLLSGICGMAVFLWPLQPAFTVGAAFGFGLINGAGRPAFITMLQGLVDRDRGALNGLFALSNQIGWALGASLGGLALDQFGYSGLGQLALAASGVASALVLMARSTATPQLAVKLSQ